MPTDTTHDDIDAETASLIQAQLAELVALKRRGVTQTEATKAYCHCNDADCERCGKQVAMAIKQVADAHARIYPEIADAMDAARYGNPGPAVRELLERYGQKIAELTAAVAALSPYAEESPKGKAGK